VCFIVFIAANDIALNNAEVNLPRCNTHGVYIIECIAEDGEKSLKF
jgi:hypothetical protein